MFKKIALIGILMTLFICGNLLASEEDPLFIQVIAQEECTTNLLD